MFIELTGPEMLDLFYQVLAKQEHLLTFAFLNRCFNDPQLTLDVILREWKTIGSPVESKLPEKFKDQYKFFFDLVERTVEQAIEYGGLIQIMEEVDEE